MFLKKNCVFPPKMFLNVLEFTHSTFCMNPGPKTIKKSRAWIGAQLTICAQNCRNFLCSSMLSLIFVWSWVCVFFIVLGPGLNFAFIWCLMSMLRICHFHAAWYCLFAWTFLLCQVILDAARSPFLFSPSNLSLFYPHILLRFSLHVPTTPINFPVLFKIFLWLLWDFPIIISFRILLKHSHFHCIQLLLLCRMWRFIFRYWILRFNPEAE